MTAQIVEFDEPAQTVSGTFYDENLDTDVQIPAIPVIVGLRCVDTKSKGESTEISGVFRDLRGRKAKNRLSAKNSEAESPENCLETRTANIYAFFRQFSKWSFPIIFMLR